ncbi:MAG: complex I NDUFA9 subunit family protein, partial [Pseudomonadota bacterium]
MSKRVAIIGGAGFLGRAIGQVALEHGWQVRLTSRVAGPSPLEGADLVACDITQDGDVLAVLDGMDSVVNCVGILAESGAASFEALQHAGAARVAKAAQETGISHLVHISAIGADSASKSAYQRTKGLGEQAVHAHFPSAVILRPSIVFGPDDSFFNRFADMSKLSPFVPVVGASTRFQPVFVGDVAKATLAGIEGAKAGTFELGGPDIETFAALMARMLTVLGRKRLVLPLPASIGMVMGFGFETLAKLSGGRIEP